jgi:uncharacterized membrane protein
VSDLAFRSKQKVSLPHVLLVLAMLAYAVVFSYLTILRFYAFEARALDMGNLDQAIWNTAHGRPFHLTNQPGTVNRLSLHVEPILIPISWLYWIYSGPPTLLVLQATVVALGAWPLFALARRQLGNDWIALLFGVAWLLNPTIQAANWLEFHPLTLAPTFLMAAFYFLIAGRTGWFVLFAVLAASCKEEIALLVMMMGLYAFLFLRRRWLGAVTMLLSLAWALGAVLVIQPTFAAGNIHWGRYAYLGETPFQMVQALLTRPDVVLAQLEQANALRYLALLLLPLGFIPLLAPEVLLLALPSLGINLLADFPPMHEVYTLIYAAPIVPFVLLAAIQGTKRVIGYAHQTTSTHADRRVLRNSQFTIHNSQFTLFAVALLIAISTLYTHQQFGYLPGGGNFRLYTITDHHRQARVVLDQIPPDAKVSAQDRLNPHVSGRETVYIFPRIEDADTVLIDVTGPTWPLHPNDIRRRVDELLAGDFGIAAGQDGYLLLRKGITQKSLPESFFTAWQPNSPPTPGLDIHFGNELRLLDYEVTTDSNGELVTRLLWQALKPIEHNLRFYVGYLDSAGNVLHDTEFYPPIAELWYPTAQWPVDRTILVQTLPWMLEADRFTLVVALTTVEDVRQIEGRLPVTTQDAGPVLLEGDTLLRLGRFARTEANTWSALPLPPPMVAGPGAAEFGGQVRLDNWQFDSENLAPGDHAPIVFAWYALQQPAMDFSVFVHLLDESGNKVAQLDWQPHDAWGPRPMTSWRIGQTILDEQILPVPVDLPPGAYELILGVYDWQNGERLPVDGANARPDQTTHLQTVVIE